MMVGGALPALLALMDVVLNLVAQDEGEEGEGEGGGGGGKGGNGRFCAKSHIMPYPNDIPSEFRLDPCIPFAGGVVIVALVDAADGAS